MLALWMYPDRLFRGSPRLPEMREASMMEHDVLVARLREAIKGPSALSGLTPEQVARGLRAAQDQFAALWMAPQQRNGWDTWAAIQEAFLRAVSGKEGE